MGGAHSENSGCIQLRKTLNIVSQMLFGPQCGDAMCRDVQGLTDVLTQKKIQKKFMLW
jgi:hypothetical protein